MKVGVLFVLLMFLHPLVNVAQRHDARVAEERKVETLKRRFLFKNWHLGCVELDTVYGADVYRAYDYLKNRQQKTKTIVAIIDSGIDVSHEDLKDNLWCNRGEIPGNGIDDDNNGYVDDVHGWNFLGFPDGQPIKGTQVADWEFLRLRGKYMDADTLKLSKKEKKEYNYFKNLVCRFAKLATPTFSRVQSLRDKYVKRMYQKRDARLSLGDGMNSLKMRYHGNNNLLGDESYHGSHVAGIVGATRENGIGIDGVADVELMILKILDGGDEQDKDVASAIYYAVDNGARVVNMSFSKYFPQNKKLVEKAMRYAERKGVLLVNAAGNDHCLIDEYPAYPYQFLSKTRKLKNFICVGSINAFGLVSSFSNYGKKSVDIFAPGDGIVSTVLDDEYRKLSGTSMAAPVVTGVAALIWNYFPELSVEQVKRAILEGGISWEGRYVNLPGDRNKVVDFAELCVSGRILNALQSVKLAEQMYVNLKK